MTKRNVLFNSVGIAVVCLALASVGKASVPRAFVSINGIDTNPCSATQPCRSFSQALAAVQAGGEIVVQNSGGYSTGFTIAQSVTIDAAGYNASVISTSASDLCTISAGPADRVVLRGLNFHGAGIGQNAIKAAQVGSLYVEHCSISEFSGNGVDMPNGGNLFVTGTDVRACNDGIAVTSNNVTAGNVIAHDSRFTECSVGVFLRAISNVNAKAALSNCTASLCFDGFFTESDNSGSAVMTLTNCGSVANLTGLVMKTLSAGDAIIRLANCAVTDNNIGFLFTQSGGGTAAALGTNPATNLVSGNTTNLSTQGSITLQ